MEFKEKLGKLRMGKGYSQEALAEKLGVSRQAVTKWELGHGYPDIDNLIKISDLFTISIDLLLRAGEDDCFVPNTSCDSHKDESSLVLFLIKAKKSTYAANGSLADSSRPESKDLHYSENEYLYIDTYVGGEKFGGQEAVWYQGKPIYCMNYAGRLLGEEFSGKILKEALQQVPSLAPFRGPGVYQRGDYTYHCIHSGDIEWFQGYEEIYYQSKKVYELYFHGGKIQ